MQLEALFGKNRTRIFNLFFLDKNRDFTAAEVARELEIPHSTARERLRKLEAGEVLVFRKRGNLTLFQLNQKSPIFPELEKIVTLTRRREIQKKSERKFKIGSEKFKAAVSNSKKVFKKIPAERKFLKRKEILHSARNGKKKARRGGFSALIRLKLER